MPTVPVILTLTRQELQSVLTQSEDVDRVMYRIETQLARRCSFILARGQRKGDACARRSPGQDFCKTHTRCAVVQDRPGCMHVFQTGQRRNEMCNRRIRDGETKCARHRTNKPKSISNSKPNAGRAEPEPVTDVECTEPEPVTDVDYTEPELVTAVMPFESDHEDSDQEIQSQEDQLDFQPTYSEDLTAKIADETIPRIRPILENGSDNDSEWDTSDLTEIYAPNRSWGCQYWIQNLHFFCLEPTVVDDQFCAKHKRFAGKVPYKLGPHNYPLLEVDSVYFKTHNLTGQYWFPRLLLSAKPTSEGLVVIGRLLGQRWIQSLTRREIKRCQNNGLLYKVLPQEVVHFNYHIPNIETIPGRGFTSFHQLRRERPRLYLKYWRIWNHSIETRKAFFERHRTILNANAWRKEHTCPLPNWNEFEEEFKYRGLRNAVIPPPTIEQVQVPDFDPWEYCESMNPNAPNQVCFPPYLLDYPDPWAMRFRPFGPSPWQEESVNVHTPRRIKHYNRKPEDWLDRITTEGREWMQIYF